MAKQAQQKTVDKKKIEEWIRQQQLKSHNQE